MFINKLAVASYRNTSCRTSRQFLQMSSQPVRHEIARLINAAQAFCFDVDSTVITKEGIDELAAFKGVGRQVSEWTAQAMGGAVPFQDALKARLDIIQPSRADVEKFLQEHPFDLSPGIVEVVNLLHERGKFVYLVSGGFRQMVEPVAEQLRIPLNRVFANRILYNDANGEYSGFDSTEPTSREGGKRQVVQYIIDAHGLSPIVMVGDGATDLQAKPPADVFVGFGGVVVRDTVKQGADWFIDDFQHLSDVLKGKLAPY